MFDSYSLPTPPIDPWLLIVVDDPDCVAFWACLLDVSTECITDAVAKVGGDAHQVDAYLRRRH
jgi:hypothetical protein